MKILFIGSDERTIYIYKELRDKYDVEKICIINRDNVNNDYDISKYNVIILPTSGISDNLEIKSINGNFKIDKDYFRKLDKKAIVFTGILNKTLIEMINKDQIISYFSDKEVKRQNDYITVDGIISLIKDCDKSKICILGYGDIGKILVAKLIDYDILVGTNNLNDLNILRNKAFLTDDKEKFKMALFNSSLVINTVSSNIITSELLDYCDNTFILDIASFPHGVDPSLVKGHTNYKLALGIPNKHSPCQSGKILGRKIIKEMRRFN